MLLIIADHPFSVPVLSSLPQPPRLASHVGSAIVDMQLLITCKNLPGS